MDAWEQSIRKMAAWIDTHLDENLTLWDMAREIGYSPYYCSMRFHAMTGMTIKA